MAMAQIPHIAHFVFGLQPQIQPFHLLHYLAIETCRRILRPETIFLHYHDLPFGVYWDVIRPHLTLCHVDLAGEVLGATYDSQLVPQGYRYAHHSDFVRLDALIEHGGVYIDIDTIFLRPLADALFEKPFVIGREQDFCDELTGEMKPTLCNAFLMSAPGSEFATTWRQRMGSAMNGTWNNHSCILPHVLSEEIPEAVHIEPEASFYPAPCSVEGLKDLLEDGALDTSKSYSVHLWQHLWWDFDRRDFSSKHAGDMTVDYFRESKSPLGSFVRPYLPDIDTDDLRD